MFQSPDLNTFLDTVAQHSQPLSIHASGGNITFTYGSQTPITTSVFDAAANWKKPKTLKLYFWSTTGGYHYTVNLKNLRFVGM